MSDDRSFERTARAWLEIGPNEAPERAVDAALLATDTTPQERALRRIPWRFPSMITPARAAAVTVIGVLVVGGAFLYVGNQAKRGVGGPSVGPVASPSTSPAASPSAASDVQGVIPNQPLSAGRWRSQNFEPAISFEAANVEWTALQDVPKSLVLRATLGITDDQHHVVTEQFILVDNIAAHPCQPNGGPWTTLGWSPGRADKAPGVGFSSSPPEAFMGWLGASAKVKVARPSQVEVAGYRGLRATVSAPTGSLASCGGFFYIVDTEPDNGFGIQDGAQVEITALAVGGRTVLLIREESGQLGSLKRAQAVEYAADALLASVRFDP